MNSLRHKIQYIDNRASGKYSTLCGSYKDNGNVFSIKSVQGIGNNISDVIYTIPTEKLKIEDIFKTEAYAKIIMEDYILREINEYFVEFNEDRANSSKGNDGKGALLIFKPDQRVLNRNIVNITAETIEIKFKIILPLKNEAFKEGKVLSLSDKRKDELSMREATEKKGLVSGKVAEKLLCKALPSIMHRFIQKFSIAKLKENITLLNEQQYMREYLKNNGFVAFIGNGSILPREGDSDMKPLGDKLIPFKSPDSLELNIELPCGKFITGMGIKKGITLIVGAGYHGKSTLIEAIENGTYNHILGDGREYVITEDSALNIFAEDGRSIKNVDISMFLEDLPTRTDTKKFSTDTASGSTSQAAAIMEAIEVGCKLMLVDEDRSANNFMTKDVRMQKLITRDTIIPYIDRVKQFYSSFDVSSILVIGGSGDFLDIADTIIMMDNYIAKDVTSISKEICTVYTNKREYKPEIALNFPGNRVIRSKTIFPYVNGKECLQIKASSTILFGTELMELKNTLTWATDGQLCTILLMLRYISIRMFTEDKSISEIIDEIYTNINKYGIEVIAAPINSYLSEFEYVRPVEFISVINRMRTIEVR